MKSRNARFDVMAELPALMRYGHVLTRNREDTEELVQEALLRAYERRSTFRKDAALKPWLLSIVHNCYIDGQRRRQTERAHLALAAAISAQAHQEPPQDHQLRLAQLRQRFMALPEDQRTAIHLIAIEGLSYQEAATMLGIPVGTLMSRLGRARATLRALEDAPAAAVESPAAPQMPPLKIVGGTDDSSR
ncbi:MAG: sigma-70 family RNA polymerase sigma factor [Rhodomicrobiaceae bacterium]